MTDTNTNPAPDSTPAEGSETKPAGEETAPTPAPTPALTQADITALKAEVAKSTAEEAKKMISQAVGEQTTEFKRNLAKQITGESSTEETNKQLLTELVNDPANVLTALGATVKKQMKDELREENVRHSAQNSADRKVVEKWSGEYPDIDMDLVEGVFLNITSKDPGKARDKAIDEAYEAVVKKTNLKSVSDQKKEGNFQATGIPGVGAASYGGGDSFDQNKSNDEFIKGLKATHQSFRRRPSATASSKQ